MSRAAYAAVDARDGHCCRICRQWTRTAHHHHIVYRSRGGKDSVDNLIRICPDCHRAIHAGIIEVSGTGDQLIVRQRQQEAL